MKNQLLLLVLASFVSLHILGNPIIPESLFAEIYFENEEWFLLIDNMCLESYDIENFDNIHITSSDGVLLLSESFLPEFQQSYTILTNEDLVSPVDISKENGWISSYCNHPDFGTIYFTYLKWGDNLNDPVKGPYEGQSLIVNYYYHDDFELEGWLLKNNDPIINGGYSYTTWGSLAGYVFDVNNVPVPHVFIEYLDAGYLNCPLNPFDSVFTNDSGYFEIYFLPARNYHICKLYKENLLFNVDEYLSIEPDSCTYLDFYIDYSVGIADREQALKNKIEIYNKPNPFHYKTEFVLNFPDVEIPQNLSIIMTGLNGSIKIIIPVETPASIENIIATEWENSLNLTPGQYLYSLTDGKNTLASGKMMISR